MKSPFNSLQTTVVLGLVLTVVMVFLVMGIADHGVGAPLPEGNGGIAMYVARWAHVVSGIMWIGLLWYFNFVQMPHGGNPRRAETGSQQVHRPARVVVVPVGGRLDGAVRRDPGGWRSATSWMRWRWDSDRPRRRHVDHRLRHAGSP